MAELAGDITTKRRCGNGDCRNLLNVPLQMHDITKVDCNLCGHVHEFQDIRGRCADHSVSQCVWCGGREFFIRKDFPQRLGMAMVIVFGVVASVFYYFENVVATFATLASLVVIDAVIYLFVGKVTVCYKCRAEFRGVVYNPEHQPFDLATSEKYSH